MLTSLLRLWRLLDRAGRRELVALSILILIGALLEGAGLGSIFPVLKLISDPDAITREPWLANIYQSLGAPPTSWLIVLFSAIAFSALAIKNIVRLYVTACQGRFIWNNRTRLATALFRHYLDSPLSRHLAWSTPVLLRNVSQSVQEIFVAFVLPGVQIITEAMASAVILLLLFLLDPFVTIGVTVALMAPVALLNLGLRRRLRAWAATQTETNAEILAVVTTALSGVKEVKANGKEGYFEHWLDRVMGENSIVRRHGQTFSSLPPILLETMTAGAIFGTIIVTVLLGGSAAKLIPTLGTLALAAFRLMPSLGRIATAVNNLRAGEAAFSSIEPDIRELRSRESGNADLCPAPVTFKSELRLAGISFTYPGQAKPTLNGIDLSIPRGASVALVGPSGGGKSTLVDVLLGLLDPSEGQRLLDGRELSKETLRSWRQRVGYVPQDVFILEDTLRRNIAFGDDDEAVDDVRLCDAVACAQLSDFVANLPRGLETQVGERGKTLSGGQRQRIGIARALYRQPDIIFMDEATSALDGQTESSISTAIDALAGDKTLVIVAHRLTTVRHCNLICFVQDGRIEARGRFDELIQRHPDFAEMVRLMSLEETGRKPRQSAEFL